MSDPAEVYREYKAKGGVADLSTRLKLRLSGADRVRFLNGQVTANATTLAPGRAAPACITTAKGRLCAEVMLHAHTDFLLVDAEPSLTETLPARLHRYIIADDVEIADVTNEFRLIHLLGDVAPGADLADVATLVTRALRFGRDGWDLFVSADVYAAIWPQLSASVPVLDEAMRETIRLEAGLPRWGYDLDENTLPPEAGLERTHIDYHKGCYIGQEVISRLKSVGHVNRELSGFISRDGEPLRPGLKLFPPDDDGGRPVGELTSAAYSFALARPIALGYLKRGAGFPALFARCPESSCPDLMVTPHALPLVS